MYDVGWDWVTPMMGMVAPLIIALAEQANVQEVLYCMGAQCSPRMSC